MSCSPAGSPLSQGRDEKPRRVEKPWGYEIWWAQTDTYAGKLLHVKAGHRLSLQLHREKDESSYVLSGRLILMRGPNAQNLHQDEIGPGFMWRVEPGLVHSIEALEDSVVLEASTPHLDDVIRLDDWYGREEGLPGELGATTWTLAPTAPETKKRRSQKATEMNEIIRVKAVESRTGYRLLVSFDDGAVKEIYLGEMLAEAGGVFLPLRDPNVFAQVRANPETGTIEWPGEVDLDPEVLYGRYEPSSGGHIIRRTVCPPSAADG